MAANLNKDPMVIKYVFLYISIEKSFQGMQIPLSIKNFQSMHFLYSNKTIYVYVFERL